MALFDKFKDMIGIEDQYDEDYYDDLEDNEVVEKKQENEDYTLDSEKIMTKRSNIMSLQANTNSSSTDRVKINIHEPIGFDNSPAILDSIMRHKVVVLNLEMLEMDKKRQVFDFVSGGIYALKGKIQKVTKDIFIIVPSDVEIDGKLKERIEEKGFYQY